MMDRTGSSASSETSLPVAPAASVGVLHRWRTPTARRYRFGYTLLAPAILYVGLLVGVPFVFSLYLAMSDANVGEPIARFTGPANFRAALESPTF
jgi:multiple sugar transport system permease protein